MPKCKCGNDGWWLTDCKGIPLKLVCDDCVEEVEKEYTPGFSLATARSS